MMEGRRGSSGTGRKSPRRNRREEKSKRGEEEIAKVQGGNGGENRDEAGPSEAEEMVISRIGQKMGK
jgi:hypothetical protein